VIPAIVLAALALAVFLTRHWWTARPWLSLLVLIGLVFGAGQYRDEQARADLCRESNELKGIIQELVDVTFEDGDGDSVPLARLRQLPQWQAVEQNYPEVSTLLLVLLAGVPGSDDTPTTRERLEAYAASLELADC
jgi:hypothetical protein